MTDGEQVIEEHKRGYYLFRMVSQWNAPHEDSGLLLLELRVPYEASTFTGGVFWGTTFARVHETKAWIETMRVLKRNYERGDSTEEKEVTTKYHFINYSVGFNPPHTVYHFEFTMDQLKLIATKYMAKEVKRQMYHHRKECFHIPNLNLLDKFTFHSMPTKLFGGYN